MNEEKNEEIKEATNEAKDIEKTEMNSNPEKEKETVFSQPDEKGVRFYDIGGKKTPQPKQRLRKNLIILSSVVVVILLLGVIGNSIASIDGSGNSYPSDDYIAKISVEGAIMSQGNTDYFGTPIGYQHQWTLETIDDLIYDDNNKGLILFVNSPGGGVYESDELYLKIKDYQEATGRPVYSSMGTMAASGGYYISAPCDKIIANRNCWTGSIGVTMGTMFDFSEFLAKYGIKTHTVTSGANKAMGSAVDPMTEEQKQIFQSLVDEAYNQFVGLVAEGRGLDINKVKELADGRIYTAKQALDLGLVDKIGTFDEAVSDMKDNYNLWNCEVAEISTNDMSLLGSLFGKVTIPAIGAKGDAAAVLELVEGANKYPVSYMCEALQ